MHTMQALIETIRALRKDVGVAEKEAVPVELRIELNLVKESIEANLSVVERLARVSEVRFVSRISAGLKAASWFFFDVAVVYERTVDVAAERDRLTKDIVRYEKGVAAAERQLGNEAFLAKAPAQVVEGLKKQEAETRQLLEKARIALNALLKDCL
jgi:valyl-tRNA synthetase